jgi:hypothetical protein
MSQLKKQKTIITKRKEKKKKLDALGSTKVNRKFMNMVQ